MHPKDLSIEDFDYNLPIEKIAVFPSKERDQSKLLILHDEHLENDIYRNIANYLPKHAVIIFNNTEVIPARLIFHKPSGASIEIFCLEPLGYPDYLSALDSKGEATWKCFVGGMAKWKQQYLDKIILINTVEVHLFISVVSKEKDAFIILFRWNNLDVSFKEIIQAIGSIPLPPYIKRKAEAEDALRYQTIFAKEKGSVAAPTASLHFSPLILDSLAYKSIDIKYLTLHVGAGTFKPVNSSSMVGHEMHAEWISIDITFLKGLVIKKSSPFILVGTTSARTMESLYWMGIKIIQHPMIDLQELSIKQWEVYDMNMNTCIPREDALNALIIWMQDNNKETLFIQTQIMIAPGYKFKMTDYLITNFHQPKSTLLLLIAAAIGGKWKDLYSYALNNNYRFLSYGDGCLLKINKRTSEQL